MNRKNNIVASNVPPTELMVNLPGVSSITGNMLDELTKALEVNRNVVASGNQIEYAWSQLPRLLFRIPPHLRDDKIVKTCIAIASGLFDSAINYIWNAAVIELREKVRQFGLEVIPQILDDKSFDEASLLDLKDSELLDLCRNLNLISDQDYFFLDQCRATRNNYSVAHPSDETVDEDEVINFLSRCQKHALSSKQNPKGVNTKKLLTALNKANFTKGQREEWENRIRGTFDTQRQLIFGMLHGICCDPDAREEARVNAKSICRSFKDEFSPKTQSLLLDRHQDYRAKGDEKRYQASQQFFETVGLMSLLSEVELHSLITAASRNLLSVHNGWNNFHNEPPFAERLVQLTGDTGVPKSAQPVFVDAVVTCGVGNPYGVSNAAMPSYRMMVKSFSPREVKIMLGLPKEKGILANRLNTHKNCAEQFRALVKILDKSSVPTSAKTAYRKWRQQK